MFITPDDRSVRIFATFTTGLGYIGLATLAMAFLRHKLIGHRLVIRCFVAYVVTRSLSNFFHWASLRWSFGEHYVSWCYLLSATSLICFVGIGIWSYKDLLVTLQTTELAEDYRRELVIDRQQIALNYQAMDENTKAATKSLLSKTRQATS